MRIQFNGCELEVAATTVVALLQETGMAADRVAVERNLELVPRRQWETTALAEGDRIEVVQFVGGG